MAKRSREASFTPSADPASSSVSVSDSGDEAIHPSKINALSMDQEHAYVAMQCSLPPHRDSIDFPSIDAFEVHYAKDHSNRCSSCGKNFPSAHFLALHLDEHHNPLREELEAKGEKTYGCFVEGCEKLCSNPQKRRLHLIDKHAFPRVYNFRVITSGVDKSISMLRESTNRRRVSTSSFPADAVTRHRRKSSQHIPNDLNTAQKEKASTKAEKAQATEHSEMHSDPVNDLAQSMSALRFVPPSVSRKQETKKPK